MVNVFNPFTRQGPPPTPLDQFELDEAAQAPQPRRSFQEIIMSGSFATDDEKERFLLGAAGRGQRLNQDSVSFLNKRENERLAVNFGASSVNDLELLGAGQDLGGLHRAFANTSKPLGIHPFATRDTPVYPTTPPLPEQIGRLRAGLISQGLDPQLSQLLPVALGPSLSDTDGLMGGTPDELESLSGFDSLP